MSCRSNILHAYTLIDAQFNNKVNFLVILTVQPLLKGFFHLTRAEGSMSYLLSAVNLSVCLCLLSNQRKFTTCLQCLHKPLMKFDRKKVHQRPLSSDFFCRSESKDGHPGLWYEMSSTKLVVSGPLGKQRWPPWSLI